MKILKLKLRKHPILGDQDLSFLSVDKNPYRVILFAGENGVGKSTVVDIIHDFCNLNIPKLDSGELREIKILLDLSEINSIRYPGSPIPSLDELTTSSVITLGFDNNVSSQYHHFYMKAGAEQICHCQNFLRNKHSKRILGSIYMDHDLNRAVSSYRFNTDGSNWKGRRSTDGAGFSSELGISTLYSWIKEEERTWNKYPLNLRKQFGRPKYTLETLPINNAIAQLIPSLSVHALSQDGKGVIMKKGNVAFPFRNLSSGEKQILGMTSFLTYDLGVSNGAPILIDEPENNLHPNLQLRLRSYFRKLFPDDRQIFIVTHSPFVIHNEPLADEKVFIFKRIRKRVSISDLGEFPGWEHVKKVNEVFSISHLHRDLTNTPVILVEGQSDERYFNEVKDLYFGDAKVKIEWVGSYNKEGNAVFTGNTALDKVKEFIISNSRIVPRKLMLLYDFDVASALPKVEGNLHIERIPKSNRKTVLDKGIENALILPKKINMDQFYRETSREKPYGGVIMIRSFEKTRFAEYICSLPKPKKDRCLRMLKELLSRLLDNLDVKH